MDSLASSVGGSRGTGRSEMTVGRVATRASGRMEEADRILREVALIDPENMVGGSLEMMRVRLARCVHLAGEDGLVNQYVGQLEEMEEEEAPEWVDILETWMVKSQGELHLQKARLASMETVQAERQQEARCLRQQDAGEQNMGPRLGGLPGETQ